jgi:spore coat protein GerQ
MISQQQGDITQQRTTRVFSEDFLDRNRGKKVTVYMVYEGSNTWRDKVFSGVVKEVGRDFFVLREQRTGKDIMLLNINLSYAVYEEPVLYKKSGNSSYQEQ